MTAVIDKKKVLLQAAELADRPGTWRKHALLTDPDGRHLSAYEAVARLHYNAPICGCVQGLVRVAAAMLQAPHGTDHAALAELQKYVDRNLAHWNDDSRRTSTDVATSLRETARLLEPLA